MEAAIRLPPLLPSPRAPRGPRAHQGRREGAACLDDRHLRARGDGRAHTHTHSHAAAATDTIGRRRTEGQREDTPRVPPGAATAAAFGPEPPPGATLPTSADYSQNSCKFGRFLNQCSKCGLQNKRERNHARSLASSLRVGIRHLTAATPCGSNASRAPTVRPPHPTPREPPSSLELQGYGSLLAGNPAEKGQTWGGGEI